jgi:cobalt/nickel transport system ATP-binding protein
VSHHVVEVRDLSYTYPDGTEAVSGVSFSIEHGIAVAIVGGNGAGKSTLLLHLNGCLTPTAGTVRIGDQMVGRDTSREVRRAVGIVFQDPDDQLFMPTVAEDVAFGPMNDGMSRPEVERLVAESLGRVGMAHVRDRPPYRLSAGEKRAVAIATVLAMSPDVLVMDEPSSNLDPRARRRLIGLLSSFEHTRIIATHDLELVVEVCSRVLVMDSGRVVADGTPREVLGDEKLMLAHGLEKPHILRHPHQHTDGRA